LVTDTIAEEVPKKSEEPSKEQDEVELEKKVEHAPV